MQMECQEIINKNLKKLAKQQFFGVVPKGGRTCGGGAGTQGGNCDCPHCNHCMNINTAMDPAVQQDNLLVQDRHKDRCCAVLMSNPKTLHQIWDEYEQGWAGNKSARLFTPQERGNTTGAKNKDTYLLRNILWKNVEEMIARGWDATTAVSQIEKGYEGLSVSGMLKQLKTDRNLKRGRKEPPSLVGDPQAQ